MKTPARSPDLVVEPRIKGLENLEMKVDELLVRSSRNFEVSPKESGELR